MSKKKVLLRGVFINRDTNGEGVLKVGTTLIRVSTVMGILYNKVKYRKINSRGTENDGYCYSNTYVYQNVKRMNMGIEIMVNKLLILM